MQWPTKDLALLRDATIQFLNAQATNEKLSKQDRKDFNAILESLRKYIAANNGYWKVRDVPTSLRFQGWNDPTGKQIWDQPLN